MNTVNFHLHTINSHDGKNTAEEMCLAAEKAGLKEIAITDHCDTVYSYNPNVFKSLIISYNDAFELQQKYINSLYVACGVEIGDCYFDEDFVSKLINMFNYDVILLSVHTVRYKAWQMPFSLVDFSDKSDSFINEYLNMYFDELLYSAQTADYDILCHLTVPLRYICGKYKKTVNLNIYSDKIDSILKTVIERKKTLEINTSEFIGNKPYFMPNESIINRYIDLGGHKFTTGSDAHTVNNIYTGINEAKDLLKSKGTNELYIYKNRKEQTVKF